MIVPGLNPGLGGGTVEAGVCGGLLAGEEVQAGEGMVAGAMEPRESSWAISCCSLLLMWPTWLLLED